MKFAVLHIEKSLFRGVTADKKMTIFSHPIYGSIRQKNSLLSISPICCLRHIFFQIIKSKASSHYTTMMIICQNDPKQLSFMLELSQVIQVCGSKSLFVQTSRGTGKKYNKIDFFTTLSLPHQAPNQLIRLF